MVYLRRRVRKRIAWGLTVVSILTLFPVVSNILKHHTDLNLSPYKIPYEMTFLVYLSWIILLANGVIIYQMRKNRFSRMFAVVTIGIAIYWIIILVMNQ